MITYDIERSDFIVHEGVRYYPAELLQESQARNQTTDREKLLAAWAKKWAVKCISIGMTLGTPAMIEDMREATSEYAIAIAPEAAYEKSQAKGEQTMNDKLLSQGLHEAFCIVRDSSVEVVGQCNCRLRRPPPQRKRNEPR